ncbi:MAG: hypothetical protein BGO49_13275 [Planctomycetales bacterium 71-10]|nr:MAG: hypothetical protein BGO49_13275 [Planctomycetales bacterium 71-10]
MSEEIQAGERLLREFDAYEPVHVAFWMRKSDEDERYLYIASDRINSGNIDVAYSEALRVAQKLGSPYMNPFRIKLINSSDRLARAAIVERDRFPAPLPARLGGKSFGGVDAADVYIYPAFDHAATP